MAAFTSTTGGLKEEVEELEEREGYRDGVMVVTEEKAKQCIVAAEDVHGRDKKKKKKKMLLVETSTNNIVSGTTVEESPSHRQWHDWDQ